MRRVPVSCGVTVAPVALLTLVSLSTHSVLAQQNTAKPLTIIREWTNNESSRFGVRLGGFSSGIISSSGSLEVHLGPRQFRDGLYVKNLLTGEDKLIVKNANGFEEFDNLSFSPDGTRIMFHACPPVGAGCDSPTVDTVNIDGVWLFWNDAPENGV
jgi:hypothetical protein